MAERVVKNRKAEEWEERNRAYLAKRSELIDHAVVAALELALCELSYGATRSVNHTSEQIVVRAVREIEERMTARVQIAQWPLAESILRTAIGGDDEVTT